MWHNALTLPQRRFRNVAKMFQAQNHKGLYQSVGDMPQVWDDIRASYDHPTTTRFKDYRRQSFLEVKKGQKWSKKTSVNPLHGKLYFWYIINFLVILLVPNKGLYIVKSSTKFANSVLVIAKKAY